MPSVRCSDKMNKSGKVLPRDPFKGKGIELAPTEELDMFRSLAEEFMEAIFCMEPGSYLITDESSLRDFKGVEELELPDMHRRVREVYGVDVSDIVSGNLVQSSLEFTSIPMVNSGEHLRVPLAETSISNHEKACRWMENSPSAQASFTEIGCGLFGRWAAAPGSVWRREDC
jgi:hypothetical protein